MLYVVTECGSFFATTCRVYLLIVSLYTQGAFIVSQAFTKALLEERQEAGERKGAIVNIISLTTKCSLPTTGHYAASKAAALAMTKNCAVELAR